MTQAQKVKFLSLCKEFKVSSYELVRYYEICYTTLVEKLHAKATKERLRHPHSPYYLVDSWILAFNRRRGTDQSPCVEDLKVGMAKSHLNPIDFLFERLAEIREYREKKWIEIAES
jgi:hypothetical protein